MSIRTVTKALAGKQDLLLGNETRLQQRGNTSVEVQGLSADILPRTTETSETVETTLVKLISSLLTKKKFYSSMTSMLADAANWTDQQILFLGAFHTGVNTGINYKVNISGDLTKHDGGNFIDVNNAADLTTWDATAQATWYTAGTGTGILLEAIYSGDIDIKWFGAKPNTNIDKTLTQIFSIGGSYFSSEENYILADNFTIDVNKVKIDFGYSKIDASGIPLGYLFTFIGTINPPYSQQFTVMKNVDLDGGAKVTGHHALSFDDTTSTGDASSHTLYENINIHGFDYGHNYGSRAYLLTFSNCSIWNCETAVVGLNTVVDGGENIRWFGGSIYNNTTVGISYNNPNGSLNFHGTSLDYNAKLWDLVEGILNFNSCHLEAGDYAAIPITIGSSGTSNGAGVNINGGWILETGALPHAHTYFADVGQNCFLNINGARMNNTRSSTGKFSTGLGRVRLQNIITFDTHENDFTLGHNQSRYKDPIFSGGVVPPNTFITDDTAAITSQTTGANVILAVSALQAYNGTQSLEYTKTFGGGSLSEFILAKIPIEQMDNIGYSFFYLRPGASTGDVIFSIEWLDEQYNSILGTTNNEFTTIGTVTSSATTGTTWTEVVGQTTVNDAPSGATHFVIRVNGIGWAAIGDTMYFDQIDVSSMG